LYGVLLYHVSRWAGITHRWFEQLWKAGLSPETGISLIPATRITSNCRDDTNLPWTKLVYGFQEISNERLQRLNEEHKSNYKYVFSGRGEVDILKLNYHII